MYIDIVPNRGSNPTVLLRESYREGKRVLKRTVANLSQLPMQQIEGIKLALAGKNLIEADESIEILEGGSRPHGHVDAVMTAMRRLEFAKLVASKPSRNRDLVMAMVVSRILKPSSKLGTVENWHDTTLPEQLGVQDANEDELYQAMDWLHSRQGDIEKKLARRHLQQDGIALYDLSSSYFEGITCPLAALGHNRDGKKGKLQVNYGLLTNKEGVPVSVSVYEGNTGDPKTLLPQIEKVRDKFGIDRFVIVGDRGMLTQKQIDVLKDMEGIDWIGALRPEAIKKLVVDGAIQFGLFDERNMFELSHPDFPGERLVACRNPLLAQRRAHKRESLLEATIKELDKVRGMIGRNRLLGKAAITEAVVKVLSKYKLGRHYRLEAKDDGFSCQLDKQAMKAEVEAAYQNRPPDKAQRQLERYAKHEEKIEAQLQKVRTRIKRGQLWGKADIGLRVGKVMNKFKVGKHFRLDIQDDSFEFEIDQEKVAQEASLDGIYVVRTSLAEQRMNAEQTVLGYKQLSRVEQAFRSLKTVDLLVRPIHHHLEDRVRAHIFICMLAYYVKWFMMEAWRPMTYADEDQEAKQNRDPVAPAERSQSAKLKARTKRRPDGQKVFSFKGLLSHMATIVRNKCRIPSTGKDSPIIYKDTPPNSIQREALERLQAISAP